MTLPSEPTLKDILPIKRSVKAEPRSWEELEEIIESPMRAAMHDFWEKDIKTWQCSANREDADRGFIFFEIRAGDEFLTQDNHAIAKKQGGELIKRGDLMFFKFTKEVDTNTPLPVIVAWSRFITVLFKSQK